MDVHILETAWVNNVRRLLFTSSTCIYPQYLRNHASVRPFREDDAWPAEPEEGLGLQKLYMEKICHYYTEEFGLETRVARFHNVYGPLGSYGGGLEKAPAAICRKIALADAGGIVDIWGDGKQTRSFMYVDDCVEGLHRLMQSDCPIPLNLDTDQVASLDELVKVVKWWPLSPAKGSGFGTTGRCPKALVPAAATVLCCATSWDGHRRSRCPRGWRELTLGSLNTQRASLLVAASAPWPECPPKRTFGGRLSPLPRRR